MPPDVMSKSQLLYDWQSVSMSWYRAPLWDLRPGIISCRNVAVWNLRSCIYGAPSLTWGRVCNLWCNHSMVRVAQNPKPYFTVSSVTPPTWRARFPYLCPPGTGWPSYTPGINGVLHKLLQSVIPTLQPRKIYSFNGFIKNAYWSFLHNCCIRY
jgi:hypothetical protein